ncbi:YybH family protein [Seonamhaeicola sediminis]|nr:nuclear transport factor 2 family protein [Seonamhaeicola sediminis]
MKLSTVLILVIFILFSCQTKDNKKKVEKWKEEIIKTETEFSNLSKEEGMNVAFLKYVADDGILLRNNRLIKGRDSIKQYMINNTSKGLSWKPDFVDVSLSGDLAYTYGKYNFVYKDSLGNTKIRKGIFHTVWKRQPDNNWKFVWD